MGRKNCSGKGRIKPGKGKIKLGGRDKDEAGGDKGRVKSGSGVGGWNGWLGFAGFGGIGRVELYWEGGMVGWLIKSAGGVWQNHPPGTE